MIQRRIVVGADGSAGSVAAVRWAAAEARLREAELRVLTAYHRRLAGRNIIGWATRPPAATRHLEVGHAAVLAAKSVAPDIEARCLALPGYAVPVLLHAAEQATLLVVGDRRAGRLPGLPTGSVGIQVATHARSSVVVVRGRPDADAGPVVAGVTDGPAAGAIIGRAFAEAALRGTTLLVVAARTGGPRPAGVSAVGVLGNDIDLQLDPWREKYPEVAADREVVAGGLDKVLVQRSQQAQLVVIGPRGYGPEATLLDAAELRVLQRADCPVLIART
jgi:nucleotide-binding universal stress UspA family protein